MNSYTFTEQDILALAKKAYEQGDAAFEIRADKCALLVIDLQDEFVKPGLTPFWVPEATWQIPRVKSLIEFCREKKIPVIFTAFAHTHLYLDRPKMGPFMPNRYTELPWKMSAGFRKDGSGTKSLR